MGDHSILAPSSAAQTVGCPGSVMLQAMYPEREESDEAREGTAAHEVGALFIESGARANLPPVPGVGWTASNGVVVTEGILESARTYADDVIATMHELQCYTPRIEQRVLCRRVHELSWGTPDCALYSQASNTLYVWDFKHGHLVVEAFENWQGINYVAGLIDELRLDDQTLRVVIRIAQPRAHHREGPVREWRVRASDLRGYVNQLAHASEKALSADPGTKAGTHCTHCRGRHACPTLQRAAMAALEYVGGALPDELTPDAIGLELRLLKRAEKLISARTTGLEAQAEAMLRRGGHVPGWALLSGRGRERWNLPAAEVATLGDLYKKDLRKPVDVVTPKQARALGIPAEVVAACAGAETGLKLAEDDGSRARHVFTQSN